MNVVVLTPVPPTGEGTPGQLLMDLPSRTLWGVVDPSVDPAGAVLLSDIQALAGQLAQATDDANAYTDSHLVNYALKASPAFTGTPTAPTPATADNDTSIATTAFVKAAIEAATPEIPIGMIAMYSGPLSNIGIGAYAGWHLCDGSAGTPDLRDRFVFGAGNVNPKTLNPASSLLTDIQGQHQHGAVTGYYTLLTADIPSHTHTFADTSSTTSSGGAHAHMMGGQTVLGTTGAGLAYSPSGFMTSGDTNTGSAGAHTHTVSVSGTTSAAGGGGAHRHTIAPDGSHQHSVTSVQLKATLPSMALAYIMKIS